MSFAMNAARIMARMVRRNARSAAGTLATIQTAASAAEVAENERTDGTFDRADTDPDAFMVPRMPCAPRGSRRIQHEVASYARLPELRARLASSDRVHGRCSILARIQGSAVKETFRLGNLQGVVKSVSRVAAKPRNRYVVTITILMDGNAIGQIEFDGGENILHMTEWEDRLGERFVFCGEFPPPISPLPVQ
jgi:hypothetical protein